MADKAKLLKVAQKHLSKGNLDKAILTFQDLVVIDPRDQRLLLRLAELQARTGRKKEAIQSYEKTAEGYIKHDFIPKAIAVYKTILRLDPDLLAAYEKLAELYKSQGLEAEALSQLENLFGFYEKSGDEAKQIEVLNLMVEMDPENLGFQVRLGEMLAKKGMGKEAAEAFAKAAATLSRRGFHDRASQLFEKIIGLDPDNTAVRKELCAHYLESGQFSEAQREIETILEIEPDDPRMVLLLGRILFKLGKKGQGEERIAQSINLFLDAGELEGVIREFLFVAQSHLRNGELDEAEAFYRPIIEAAPFEDRGVRGLVSVAETRKDRVAQIKNLALLGRILQRKGDEKGALKAYGEVHELDPLNDEANDFLNGGGQKVQAIGELDPDGPEGVGEEAGLEEIAEIEEVELFPEEVLELVVETGEVVEVLELEESEEAEVEGPEELVMEEVKLSESGTEGEDELPDIMLEDFTEGIEVFLEGGSEEEIISVEEDVPHLETVEEEGSSVEDLLAEAEVYRRYGLQEKLTETLEKVRSIAPDDLGVLGRIQAFDQPAESQEELTDALDQTVADMDIEAGIASTEDVPEIDQEAEEEVPGADRFQEDLEEAEFYLSQGLEEEAHRIYRSILSRSPGHPVASQALIGTPPEASLPVETPPEAAPEEVVRDPFDPDSPKGIRSKLTVEDSIPEDGEGFLDLAEELREELASEFVPPVDQTHEDAPVNFEDIFAQFKKGIEETLGEEEYETHYNLGIAYKDMGLFDDALREFEVGSRDPDLTQDSLSLMAMCFMEKKDFDSAVKAVQKALEGSPEGSKTGLFYQLGEVFEKMKDWKEALSAYGEVQSRDPSFGGIEEVLDRVRSQAGHEIPEEEEIEATFEGGMDDMLTDLIREVEEMAKENSGETEGVPEDDPGKGKKDRISYL